jgi:DNA primase large subunit
MRVELKIEGLKKTLGNLSQVERQMADIAYNKALESLGVKIGEISKDKVPVDKGQLKQSFSVQKVGNDWICGYNKVYAAYQHQGVRKDGSRIVINRPGGGESFFLSGPVQKNQTQLIKFLQEQFEIELQKIKLS